GRIWWSRILWCRILCSRWLRIALLRITWLRVTWLGWIATVRWIRCLRWWGIACPAHWCVGIPLRPLTGGREVRIRILGIACLLLLDIAHQLKIKALFAHPQIKVNQCARGGL